jgi:hypothetical protein
VTTPSDRPNRRVYERFDLLAQVRVRQGTLDHVLEIINISRGGALVDLGDAKPRWLALRRVVEVRLLAEDGSALLDATGSVVRIVETLDKRMFAIEFDTPQDDEIIRRALKAAGKPPPLPSKT